MNRDELEQVRAARPGWVRRAHLGVCVASGVGFVGTAVGQVRSSSSWERYVHAPFAIGWLIAFLVVGTAFLRGRTGTRATSMLLVGSTLLAATAVGGGVWDARRRRCDTGSAAAIVAEVVELTASTEGQPRRWCAGQAHVSRPQVTVALGPLSTQERRRIIEYLDQHGLLDLEGSAFIAVFGDYTIEVELPASGRVGSMVVIRARRAGRS